MTLITPEFLPTKTYPFSQLRQAINDIGGGLQEGVVGGTDLGVAQRAGGANMSVDVAAGNAWVKGDDTTRQGLYHVINDAIVNVGVSGADVTNPRIDQIVLQIADSSVLGTSDTPLLKVITGTPTASAQSSNPGGANYRAGAAALPNTALRLADITVPAGATSIINSNVTSRRPWARGMYLSSVGSGGDITISQTSFTGTGIGIPSGVSCECSGNPIRFAIQGVYSSGGTETFSVAPFVDGAVVTGLQRDYLVVPSFYNPLAIQWMLYPSAGAHIFAFQVKVSGGSVILAANGTTGVQSWLEELVRPNAG